MAIRIKSSDLAAFGIPEPPKRKGAKATVSKPDPAMFRAMCLAHGIGIAPEPEFQFALPRKWAFDFCWPGEFLAVEIQGGLFTGGRHVRGAALLEEQIKLNEAAIRGYRILYTTPAGVKSGAIFETIRRALDL